MGMRGDLSSHFYYRPSAPVKPTKRGGKKPIVCFLPLSDVHLRADPWNPGVEVGRASLSGVSTFSLAFHVFERRGSRPRSKRKVRSEAQERHLLHRSLRNSHDLPDPDSKASARTRLDGQREQLEQARGYTSSELIAAELFQWSSSLTDARMDSATRSIAPQDVPTSGARKIVRHYFHSIHPARAANRSG